MQCSSYFNTGFALLCNVRIGALKSSAADAEKSPRLNFPVRFEVNGHGCMRCGFDRLHRLIVQCVERHRIRLCAGLQHTDRLAAEKAVALGKLDEAVLLSDTDGGDVPVSDVAAALRRLTRLISAVKARAVNVK